MANEVFIESHLLTTVIKENVFFFWHDLKAVEHGI